MPASFWPISRAFVAAAVCCGLLASFRPPPEGRGSQVQPANPRPYVFGAILLRLPWPSGELHRPARRDDLQDGRISGLA